MWQGIFGAALVGFGTFAAAASGDFGGIESMLPNVGAFGVIVWLVYYQQTKLLPNMQAAQQTQIATLQAGHKEQIESLVAAFRTERGEDRKVLEDLVSAIRTTPETIFRNCATIRDVEDEARAKDASGRRPVRSPN